MATKTRKRRMVQVGRQEVAVVIRRMSDLGIPDKADADGNYWVCEYDRDSMANAHVAAWLQGGGVGPSEAEAVRAFIADCHTRKESDL